MAGIGSYEKGKAFALKSGNKPSFKNIGSSPVKNLGHGGKEGHRHELTNEQKMAQLEKRKQETLAKLERRAKGTIDPKKAAKVEYSRQQKIKSSPAKTTHKAEHKRKEELLSQGFTQEDADQMIKSGAVTGVDPDAPGTPGKPGYEPPVKRSDLDKKGKETWDLHRKKKPAKATGKTAKPAYIKTIQNKRAKGGKLTKAERRQLDEYRIHVTEQNK